MDFELSELDCLKLLAGAVIEGACGDYIRIDKKRFDENCRTRERLEQFFRSDEFRLYTSDRIDPEYIISSLKRKRNWNDLIREAAKERYGSLTRFAETFPRRKRLDVLMWLKSSKYPSLYEEWEKRLGVTMCDKCEHAGAVEGGWLKCPVHGVWKEITDGCIWKGEMNV